VTKELCHVHISLRLLFFAKNASADWESAEVRRMEEARRFSAAVSLDTEANKRLQIAKNDLAKAEVRCVTREL
jgi:hypothetical protein